MASSGSVLRGVLDKWSLIGGRRLLEMATGGIVKESSEIWQRSPPPAAYRPMAAELIIV